MSCEDPPFVECPTWDTLGDADIRAWAQDYAGRALWRLSGRRFGLCEITVRPCSAGCDRSTWALAQAGSFSGPGQWPGPVLVAGVWHNSCGCARSDDCSCSQLSQVWLRPPVHDVTEVLVDGVVQAGSSWSLQRTPVSSFLVRLTGDAWPGCQNLTLPDSDEGTFAVTYRRGTPWPAEAGRIIGRYACELARGAAGLDCELPSRVTSVVREGVTLDLESPDDLTVNGKTGLADVDSWVGQVNPGALRDRPWVYSPDLPQYRRV